MIDIPFANVYLTRKCNLQCHYCNVWKSTKAYDDISYYHKNEKSLDWWKVFFTNWYNFQPNTFFSILGGEPLLVNWLPDLINHLNKLGTLYTIITNCTLDDQLDNLIKNTDFIRGFTASVDVVENEYDKDRIEKSSIGFQRLISMKEKYAEKIDCCAECTLNAYNLDYAVPLIKKLNKYGIYASVSVIDPKLSEYYDFSNIEYNDRIFVQKNEKTKTIFKEIQSQPNVHMPKLLSYLYDDLPYKIQDIEDTIRYVSVDSDGKLRYNLRVRGKTVPNKVSYIDLLKATHNESNWEDIKYYYKQDMKNYDLGCNWSGIYMAKTIRLGDHDLQDKTHNLLTKEI